MRRGGFLRRTEALGSGGGAEHLARIHGTEEDRVNCPFYFKIGACRHGDRCSRLHNKPLFSQTVLIPHMYQNPLSEIIAQNGDPASLNQAKTDEEFEDFFEEIFEEFCSFGKLEEINVCDNLGDHLVGNVYVKYEDEEDAARAQKSLYGRFYAGRPLVCEFSPVTDFREARCRQFDEGTCTRGGYCNFMHIKNVHRDLLREFEYLYNRPKRRARKSYSEERDSREQQRRSISRRSSRRQRSKSKSRSRYRQGERHRSDEKRRKSISTRNRSRSNERRSSRHREDEYERESSRNNRRYGDYNGRDNIEHVDRERKTETYEGYHDKSNGGANSKRNSSHN